MDYWWGGGDVGIAIGGGASRAVDGGEELILCVGWHKAVGRVWALASG